MKKIIVLGLVLAIFIIVFPKKASTFDSYVIHPALAREIAYRYNQANSHTLTQREIELIVQGSLEEDEPIIRAFNHFYNPLTKKGLRVFGVTLGLPSPDWLVNKTRQQLSPGGDCSWPTALHSYHVGDKTKSLRCLGHALHLLEDVGVPAHTRNDQHLTGDSFEEWAKYHNLLVSDYPSAITPTCENSRDCIIELATWVNSHFVSEDTINSSNFSLPVSGGIVIDNYLIADNRKIAVYNPNRHAFFLSEEIQAEYWRHISPAVAEFGVHLLKLFFNEVGDSKDTNSIDTIQSTEDNQYEINQNTTPSITSVLSNNSESLSSSPQFSLKPPTSSIIPNSEIKKDNSETTKKVLGDSFTVLTPPQDNQLSQTNNNSLPDTYITTRPASTINTTTADFVFASDSDSVTFECRLNNADWFSCPASYHLNNLIEGTHTVAVRARIVSRVDSSPISYTWVVDLTPPITYLISHTNKHDRSASFIFGSEPGAHFQCRLDTADWQECFSPREYSELSSGTHTFNVRGIDRVGNIERISSAYQWEIEIDKPAQPTVSFPDSALYFTNEVSITLRGETGEHTQVMINNQLATVEDSGVGWSHQQTLQPGENIFSITSRNIYGETSEAVEIIVIFDAESPIAMINNLAEIQENSDFIVYWEGVENSRGELHYDVDYRVNNDFWQNWQVNTKFTQNLFTNAPLNQLLSFRVRALDQAGNIGEWSDIITTRFAPGGGEELVISQIMVGGNYGSQDEFIEIYNPSSRTVYLQDFQIEKKSAAGLFWETVVDSNHFEHSIIKPRGYFLIAGHNYSQEVIADVVVADELLYDNNGHLRILDALEREIDKIGYGGAYDPEGFSAPVPAFGVSLERKANYSSTAESLRLNPEEGNGYDSDFNFFDFVLQTNVYPRASQHQALPVSLSNDLLHLWHFDECHGRTVDSISQIDFSEPAQRIVGRYGCGIHVTYQGQDHIAWDLDQSIVTSELTLSFYVRPLNYSSRGIIWLAQSNNDYVVALGAWSSGNVIFHQGSITNINSNIPTDNQWHQVTVVFNQNHAAWYQDGELKVKLVGDYSLSRSISKLAISQDSFAWSLDEIAIWNRSLNDQEIRKLYTEQLEPHLIRPLQPSAELIHFWDFDEGISPAIDSVDGKPLIFPEVVPGHTGFALGLHWYQRPQVNAQISTITTKDISLSYWRHRGYNGSGGGSVGIYNTQTGLGFGSGGGYLQSYYFLNGWYDSLYSQIPNDDEWHHIALVYDSYAYELRYYIDGVEEYKLPAIWPILPYDALFMNEEQYGFFIDDLKIWQGALTTEEIRHEAEVIE